MNFDTLMKFDSFFEFQNVKTPPFTYTREHTLHKRWGFPLRISSLNVAKSAGDCGFGYIYWRNPQWKLYFLCSDNYNAIHTKSSMWLTPKTCISIMNWDKVDLFPIILHMKDLRHGRLHGDILDVIYLSHGLILY